MEVEAALLCIARANIMQCTIMENAKDTNHIRTHAHEWMKHELFCSRQTISHTSL